MNMEEIVALSVKHNVSDLHLCSAWPARWRIRGRMEAAPFDTPDVEELLREWQIYHAGGDGWLSQSTCRCAYSDAGRSC